MAFTTEEVAEAILKHILGNTAYTFPSGGVYLALLEKNPGTTVVSGKTLAEASVGKEVTLASYTRFHIEGTQQEFVKPASSGVEVEAKMPVAEQTLIATVSGAEVATVVAFALCEKEKATEGGKVVGVGTVTSVEISKVHYPVKLPAKQVVIKLI